MYSFDNIREALNTTSGIAEKMWLAPVSWFTKTGIKAPGAWAVKGDEIIIKDDHEFIAGKGFVQFTLAPEKNQYDAKAIGDTGFTQFANEVKVMLAGSTALLHENIKNLLNIPCIVLVRDADCPANIYYQIGNSCNHAYITADFGSGTTKDGVKGYTIMIKNSAGFVTFYAGEILNIDDAVLVNPIENEDGDDWMTEDDQLIISE